MNKKLEEYAWARVENAVGRAKAMHFDDCHKIYLSMDDAQVKEMEDCGYETVAPDLQKLRKWYSEACPLRLVSAVYSVGGDANTGFDPLIPQFFEED